MFSFLFSSDFILFSSPVQMSLNYKDRLTLFLFLPLLPPLEQCPKVPFSVFEKCLSLTLYPLTFLKR